jgi:hypothetical protein
MMLFIISCIASSTRAEDILLTHACNVLLETPNKSAIDLKLSRFPAIKEH